MRVPYTRPAAREWRRGKKGRGRVIGEAIYSSKREGEK